MLQKKTDAILRLDFDDICESSFNLKLIGLGIDALRNPAQTRTQTVPLADLVQRTLLTLAPSLDRRSMKLSTLGAAENIVAHTDPTMVLHILWMLLLGIIRYAEPESTLYLRCAAQQSEAMIGIRVSELAPGQLTPNERYAHLDRQQQRLTPHMFADTIRQHGNIQLAELLLKPLGGRIEVVPLTLHDCEICLWLPAI